MDAQPFAETQQFFVKQRCAKRVAASARSDCFPHSPALCSKRPAAYFSDLPDSAGSPGIGCFCLED